MLKSLLNFIGGKDTDIFNKKGRVQHEFSQEKWKAWDNRLAKNPKYNWKKHSGKEPIEQPVKEATNPSK